MRRLTAIAVLLYFVLLPGATVFAASDNALSPCCRGNGAHHCNRHPLHGGTQVSPTNVCPYRIGHSAVANWLSVLEPRQILPGMQVGTFLPSEYSGALLHELIRTAADRGPPARLS